MFTKSLKVSSCPKLYNPFFFGFFAFLFLALAQPYAGLYRVLFYIAMLPLLTAFILQIKHWLSAPREYTTLILGFTLIAYLLATTIWTPSNPDDNFGHVRKGVQTLAFFYGAYLFGTLCGSRRKLSGELLQTILIISISVSLWIYVQNGNYPQRISGVSRVLNNPIPGSIIFTVILLLSLYLKRRHNLIMTGVAILLTLAYIYLANSRTTIFALFIALGLAGLLSPRLPPRLKWATIASLAALAAMALAIPGGYEYLFDRDFHRLNIWIGTLSHMEGYWLQGHGFGLPFVTSPAGLEAARLTGHDAIMHPHSLYIATLYHGGILALVLLALFFIQLLRQVHHDIYALVLTLFVVLVCTSDNPYLFSSAKEIWFIFWLPVGLIMGEMKIQNKGGKDHD